MSEIDVGYIVKTVLMQVNLILMITNDVINRNLIIKKVDRRKKIFKSTHNPSEMDNTYMK